MKKLDITIRQGKTFKLPVLWEMDTLVYRSITGVEQSAPVRLQVPAHGAPDGWFTSVVNVKGPTELNAATENGKPPADADFRATTLVSADEVEFNKINGTNFKPYVSGGQLVYYQPGDFTGAKVQGQIKDKIGGTVLYEFRSDGATPNVTIDVARSRATLRITPAEAAAFAWKGGVYDLEVVDAAGDTWPLLQGTVTLEREVTTITS